MRPQQAAPEHITTASNASTQLLKQRHRTTSEQGHESSALVRTSNASNHESYTTQHICEARSATEQSALVNELSRTPPLAHDREMRHEPSCESPPSVEGRGLRGVGELAHNNAVTFTGDASPVANQQDCRELRGLSEHAHLEAQDLVPSATTSADGARQRGRAEQRELGHTISNAFKLPDKQEVKGSSEHSQLETETCAQSALPLTELQRRRDSPMHRVPGDKLAHDSPATVLHQSPASPERTRHECISLAAPADSNAGDSECVDFQLECLRLECVFAALCCSKSHQPAC